MKQLFKIYFWGVMIFRHTDPEKFKNFVATSDILAGYRPYIINTCYNNGFSYKGKRNGIEIEVIDLI